VLSDSGSGLSVDAAFGSSAGGSSDSSGSVLVSTGSSVPGVSGGVRVLALERLDACKSAAVQARLVELWRLDILWSKF